MIANPVAARTDAGTAPHPSVAVLRTAGLLGHDETPPEQPHDLSRAHGVWGVRLPDGRRVVVKSSAPAAVGHDTQAGSVSGGSLGAELFVHRMAHWCAPLRDALPAPAAVDEANGLLVVDDLGSGHPVSLALLAEEMGDDLAFFAQLGARIGAIHRATAALPLPPAPSPLVLAVLRADVDTTALAAATRDIVDSLRDRDDIVTAATRLRAPAGRSLVHHDLKWDNIAVAAGPVPMIVDWELAGAGDPAWDLGCLVSEHLMRTDTSVPPAARALVRGYSGAARVSSRAAEVFAQRVALAAALRLVQFALEVAERAAEGDDDRARVLAANAAAWFDRTPRLTEEVSACLV